MKTEPKTAYQPHVETTLTAYNNWPEPGRSGACGSATSRAVVADAEPLAGPYGVTEALTPKLALTPSIWKLFERGIWPLPLNSNAANEGAIPAARRRRLLIACRCPFILPPHHDARSLNSLDSGVTKSTSNKYSATEVGTNVDALEWKWHGYGLVGQWYATFDATNSSHRELPLLKSGLR